MLLRGIANDCLEEMRTFTAMAGPARRQMRGGSGNGNGNGNGAMGDGAMERWLAVGGVSVRIGENLNDGDIEGGLVGKGRLFISATDTHRYPQILTHVQTLDWGCVWRGTLNVSSPFHLQLALVSRSSSIILTPVLLLHLSSLLDPVDLLVGCSASTLQSL
jgi:hypothetical protein